MTAENQSIVPTEDFFADSPGHSEHMEATRGLGNRLFSPTSFIRFYGLDVVDPIRFAEVLEQTPGLITRRGRRFGVRGFDADLLLQTLEMRKYDLMAQGVFPPEYTEIVNFVGRNLYVEPSIR